MRIALDLMGGDHAPTSVLDGALRASPEVEILLVGPGTSQLDCLTSGEPRDGAVLSMPPRSST